MPHASLQRVGHPLDLGRAEAALLGDLLGGAALPVKTIEQGRQLLL